jgi:hypothetical protein
VLALGALVSPEGLLHLIHKVRFRKYDHMITGTQDAAAASYLRIAVAHDGRKEHLAGETEISNGCSVSRSFGCHLKLYDLNVAV